MLLLLYSVNCIILVIFKHIISSDLVGMHKSDRSTQLRFSVDGILFQSGTKSQNGVVENYVFGPKLLGEKDPQNQMRTFYAPKGTHQSLVQSSPTDPDGIS